MANKRMFTMHIIDSDAFLDMPLSAQCLYFHLNMRADDDGFIGNPKRIQSMIGASTDDLKLLIAKRFVLAFDDGVIVIKHWRMHNTIRADRYTPTAYQDELSMLIVKGNKSYSINTGNQLATNWQPVVSTDIGTDIGTDLGLDKDLDLGKDKISSPSYQKRYSDDSFERKCVDYLIQSILKDMPNANVPITEKGIDTWCDYIEKMKRIDKRTESDIWSTLMFATTDSFWIPNIRSTKKFREKYETLFLQNKNKRNGKQQKQTPNKFNNFPQREYSHDEISDIERKMMDMDYFKED